MLPLCSKLPQTGFGHPVWPCITFRTQMTTPRKCVCVCVLGVRVEEKACMYLHVGYVYVGVCLCELQRGWVVFCPHWATCLHQGPLKPFVLVDRRRKAIGPPMKTCVGGGSVVVGVNGRAVKKKIKKPSDLFVGDDCAAQQEGQYLDSGGITLSVTTDWDSCPSCWRFINYFTWNVLWLVVFWENKLQKGLS